MSGLGEALLLNLAHQPTHMLTGVPGQLDNLALSHALPYGVGHGDGQRGTGIVRALLGGVLGTHCLPQRSNSLFGGGHADMFAHRGGHTEVRPRQAFPILTRGHMHVASWMWRIEGANRLYVSPPSASPKDQHMAVSKRLRYEIFKRDGHTCRYCGATAPDVKLTIDHVTPEALGGTDTPDNLVTACGPCNSGKTSSTPDAATVADVADDALRWAAAMKQAAEQFRQQETPKFEYRDAFLTEWNRWHVGKDEAKKVPLPSDWKQAMDRFRVAGLPAWTWPDIVDIGMANEKVKPENTFRYCCGIAWNKVTAIQAEARRIVDPSAAQPKLSPLPEAMVAAAIEVWCYETGEDPTGEQDAELRTGVVDALKNGVNAEGIIKAAKHAAWCGHSSIPEGLADVESDARHMGTLLAWEAAWAASSGGRPPIDAFEIFTKTCTALAKTGATSKELQRAATFAGSHLTPHLYFGLDWEHLKVANVKWARQRAVDFWASSSAAANQCWPSAEEREAVNRSIDRIRDDGDIGPFDMWAAAAAAGAYGDTDLSTCLPRHLSVFEAAAIPLRPAS